jgi:electron transfer flavoprotein alpha subunit
LISKVTQEGLDFILVTVGSDENPKIGSDTFKNTYMKLNQSELSLASVADEISKIITSETINLVLASSTYVGRDIAGFVSVDLNASPVSNVVNFKIDGDKLSTTNSIDGGESDYLTNVTSEVKVLLIRPKSFEASEIELNDNFETVPIEKNDLSVAVQDIFIEEKTGPQLEDSKIVISAGRGMVDVENLKFIEELANKLNAAIGGTRAIVDAGWMPYSQQVGQTGKTVKPDVYIACGISGATQHQVGMKDSKFIIAINKDEEAPIFQIADLGVVGDTLSIIPKLIDSL